MSNSIIDEINKKHEKQKKIKQIWILIILVICVSFLSYKIGRNSESNDNYYNDEETLMTTIYGDYSYVSFMLEHSNDWKDEKDSIMKYNGSYVQFLKVAEKLKATLDLGDRIMYNRGKSMHLHNLADSIDVSLSVIEGLEYKDRKISNNFFDDGELNESEINYIEDISKDYNTIYDNLTILKDGKKEQISLDEFIVLIEPFINKYNISDSLYELKVDN